MKRVISIFTIFLLLLTSCQKKEVNEMYIEPTKEVPVEIMKYYDKDSNVKGFDFSLDKSAQRYQLKQYKLENGKWLNQDIFFESVLDDFKGCIALDVDQSSQFMRITTQNQQTISSGGFEKEKHDDLILYKTVTLDKKEEVTYEKEIPLLLQVNTNEEVSLIFNVDKDELAKELEDVKEEVYLITILFTNEIK